MSYCVNCGVELHRTADRCALCATPVANPSQPVDETAPKPYATDFQPPPANNRRTIALLLAGLLALPIFVCLATNLVFDGGPWSIYPIGAIVLFWVLVAVPLLFFRPLPLLAIGADAATVLLYLFIIAAFDPQGFGAGMEWFLRLALPIVCVVAAAVLVPVAILRKYRMTGIQTASLLFTVVGLAIVGIEVTIDLFTAPPFRLSWSWIVLISCLAMTAALLIIERSPRLLEEIRRRLHI